jgi:PAS domain S-box-containing protein
MGRPPGVSGEALERLLVDAVEDYAIFALDPDGRVASWNEGARRIKGYAAAEILGKPYATFFTAEDTARGLPAQILERAAREGRVEEEGWRLRKDGSRFWADAVITALRDEQGELIGFAKVTRDLTERRRAEAQARRLERAQAARRAAESALRATELLAQAGSLVSSSLDYEETLRNVAAMAVPGFADFCALDLASGPELSRVAVEHADPARLRLARALGAGRPERTAAWQRGDVEYLPYIPAAAQTPPDSALHILAVVGVHAAVVAPLSAHGQHFGALTFGQTDPARGFSPADVTLARDLALRAAAAIENARLVRDLEDTRSELEAQATELE